MNSFNTKRFLFVTLLTSIWINISEVFRYLVFVRQSVKDFFNPKNGIADMGFENILVWGFWDSLLTIVLVLIVWMTCKLLGNNSKSIFIGGSIVWLSVFVIFWVATANMGLCNWNLLYLTLPLSWLEMLAGAWLAMKLFSYYETKNNNDKRLIGNMESQ